MPLLCMQEGKAIRLWKEKGCVECFYRGFSHAIYAYTVAFNTKLKNNPTKQ